MLRYIDDDSLAKVVVVWNGLEGADSRVLAVLVGSVVVIVTGQFGQRPVIKNAKYNSEQSTVSYIVTRRCGFP